MTTSTDRLACTVPDIEYGDLTVDTFTIESKDMAVQMGSMFSTGRYVPPGTYKRLSMGRTTWMTDTPDERRDHLPAVYAMAERGGRVLINGLGLGCVVGAALSFDHVERVDVVEINPDVIAAIGPHYLNDPRVVIYEEDAFEFSMQRSRQDARWDVVWHDIWPTICGDNLPEIMRLRRAFACRAGWQGAWVEGLLRDQESRDRRSAWGASW